MELTKSQEIKKAKALETLYWCKAAAVLGMPQPEIMSSTLPMASDAARRDLVKFLSDTLPEYSPPDDDEKLVFKGWKDLCKQHAPIFFEKSPHHLHYWSALQLIYQAMERLDEVEFKFIGLVRNPLDVIYSRWRRWRNDPYRAQKLWYDAYNNLLRFKDLVQESLLICRYEDLVTDETVLPEIFRFIGVQQPFTLKPDLHPRSIGRWREDPRFAFELDRSVSQFGESFGYKAGEMQGRKSMVWPLYWRMARLKFSMRMWKRNHARKEVA